MYSFSLGPQYLVQDLLDCKHSVSVCGMNAVFLALTLKPQELLSPPVKAKLLGMD